MGVTPDPRERRNGSNSHEPAAATTNDRELRDLVAAYALDAVDDDEARSVESLLAQSAAAARDEQALRDAGGAYATLVAPAIEAPAALRTRVLDTALRRRPGTGLVPASAVELHRLETERAALLFERLRGEQWDVLVDPVELQGWTVRDLVIHVLSNQTLLAQQLGVTAEVAPETLDANEARTAATAERLRHASSDEIIAEYRRFVEAVNAHASTLTDDELDADITWWGARMRASTALVVRTFETWTHADDIRRALGLPHVPPSAPALATMSTRALAWAPLIMASAGRDIEPSVATIVLTGPGGAAHTVQLGFEPAGPDAQPRFVLEADVVDFCRAIANRVPTGGLPHRSDGDVELADAFVNVLGSLAGV